MNDLQHSKGNGEIAATVLYVPPASRRRAAVPDRLTQSGLSVVIAPDLANALAQLIDNRFALCLVDLADRTALSAIRVIADQRRHIPIAGLVDPGNPLIAAEAMHAGAVDLLPWPFDARDTATLLANARDVVPIPEIDGAVSVPGGVEALITQSPAMRRVTELVTLAARGRSSVCVSGEPGTGRTLVARTIHRLGDQDKERPFVQEDCAGATPQELERRLFGTASTQRVGAGADQIGRSGALYRARGGTLLLTNLIDAPGRVQSRLARLLRDCEAIVSNGKRVVIDVDVQAIATVDMTVDVAVAEGRLRGDLYKQLAHVRIDMPALRRRREDIPLLAVHMLKQVCGERAMPPKSFSRSVLQVLTALPWNGNATELHALIETLVTAVARPVIQLDDLLEHASLDGVAEPVRDGATLRDAKARFERDCISAVLMRHHGRVPEAAKALGIQRTNLYRKIRQLNVARSLLSARR